MESTAQTCVTGSKRTSLLHNFPLLNKVKRGIIHYVSTQLAARAATVPDPINAADQIGAIVMTCPPLLLADPGTSPLNDEPGQTYTLVPFHLRVQMANRAPAVSSFGAPLALHLHAFAQDMTSPPAGGVSQPFLTPSIALAPDYVETRLTYTLSGKAGAEAEGISGSVSFGVSISPGDYFRDIEIHVDQSGRNNMLYLWRLHYYFISQPLQSDFALECVSELLVRNEWLRLQHSLLLLIAANFVWAGAGGKNSTPYSQWAGTQLTYPKYATGHLAAVR